MANSVDLDQTAPIGAVCSGSTLFDSILNFLVLLGNYLQLTTFSDAFFFLGGLRVKTTWMNVLKCFNTKLILIAEFDCVTIYCLIGKQGLCYSFSK